MKQLSDAEVQNTLEKFKSFVDRRLLGCDGIVFSSMLVLHWE